MTRVLFVCLGNICRSPMAEAIFRFEVEAAGLTDQFVIESAGTGDWHIGQLPDPRTIKVLAANGIHKLTRARQVREGDFSEFDHIIAMDIANERDLHCWKNSDPTRVSLVSSWDPNATFIEVPDPYYGSEMDFDIVFQMLERSCKALFAKLKNS